MLRHFFYEIKKISKTLTNLVFTMFVFFLNHVHLGNIDGYFMGYGTRFFYKLMLLFNSKIRKYEDKFS